jgi:hypothetical protein
MENTTLINGVEYSWSDVTVNIDGDATIKGITAISYDDTQSIVNIFGIGRLPVGRAYGPITASASITMSLTAVEQLRKKSTATGRLQDLPPFDIVVCFATQDGKIVTHVLKNCQFTSRKVDGSTSGISSAFPLVLTHVEWNH